MKNSKELKVVVMIVVEPEVPRRGTIPAFRQINLET